MVAKRVCLVAALLSAAALSTACSPPFPPSAVGGTGGVPQLAWKLCEKSAGVGAVTVSEVTNGQPEDYPAVWSARKRPGSAPQKIVAVVSRLDGYDVTTTARWPLSKGRKYVVSDAADMDGVNLVGTSPEFTLDELSDLSVLQDDGSGEQGYVRQGVRSWLEADKPDCA